MRVSEMDFRLACRAILARGEKPTPTAVNRELGRDSAHMNRLNGRETEYRRQELERAGYALTWTGGAYRYVRPEAA